MNPLPDTFHNPYLWPLLLFALLPTLLYLVDRRRARRMDWPALRFFLTRQRARLRWIRLREALLILVRSLALFLVVYALLGPATRVERELSSSSSLNRGLVLVFDTSFSMSYSPAEESGDLLKRAKARARALLDELRPTDSALIVSPRAVDRAPGDNLFDLDKTRLELEDLELGGGPFDLLHAIDNAIGKTALLSTDIREIYIFTDHQADSLPAREERSLEFLASRLAALDPAPSITLVDCGAPETSNHRIVEFKSDSLVTGTDSAIGFHARVAPAPGASGLHLRVTVNGEVIASRPLEEKGPAVRELSFSHRFSSAGTARVSAELVGEGAGDGLPGDDARHLVVEVLDRLEVPIIQNSPDKGRAGGGHWLDLALFPRYGEGQPPKVIFRPVILGSAESGILSRSRVLVLSGIPAIEPRELELIENFVRRGGGLLVFADAETDRLFANDRLWQGGRGLLPAALLKRQKAETGEAYHPVAVNLEHPVLSVFKGVSEADLDRLAIRSCWTTGPVKEKAVILSKTSGGSPWIIEHSLSDGRIIFFATGANPADTDLPRTPLFVPLLHRLIRYLALGSSLAIGCNQGGSLEVELETGERNAEIRLTLPDGETEKIADSAGTGKRGVSWRKTAQTGFYSFDIGQENNDKRTVTLAVNMDPAESNLERIDADSLELLERKLGADRLRHSQDRPGLRQSVIVEFEHWPYALLAGLLLLLCELVLLRGFASSRAPQQAGGSS